MNPTQHHNIFPHDIVLTDPNLTGSNDPLYMYIV